jgi:hypothetical protein
MRSFRHTRVLAAVAFVGLPVVAGCFDDDEDGDAFESGRTGAPCDRPPSYADVTYGYMGTSSCAAGFNCYALPGEARGKCGPAAHCALPPGPYANGYYQGPAAGRECRQGEVCIARALPPLGTNYYGECLPEPLPVDAGSDGSAADSASSSSPTLIDCSAPLPESFVHTAGRSVDYLVTCDLAISVAKTVGPGTVFAFKAGKRVVVDGAGSLKATGSDTAHIVMKAADDGSKWGGVHFFTKSASNSLTFVDVVGAGAARVDLDPAAIIVGAGSFAGAEVSIRDCVIDGSETVGLSVGEGSDVPALERIVVKNSGGVPVQVQPDAIARLGGPGNSFAANTTKVARILPVPADTLKAQAITWAKLDVPYSITGSVTVSGTNTIAAGTEIVFGKGASLAIGASAGSSIKAIGTAGSKITFRGDSNTVGYWQGIALSTKGNEFAHATISGGGSKANAFGQQANIVLDGNSGGADVSIRDCVLENSGGYGVHTGGQTVTLGQGNVFQGNVSGDTN